MDDNHKNAMRTDWYPILGNLQKNVQEQKHILAFFSNIKTANLTIEI